VRGNTQAHLAYPDATGCSSALPLLWIALAGKIKISDTILARWRVDCAQALPRRALALSRSEEPHARPQGDRRGVSRVVALNLGASAVFQPIELAPRYRF
jgi:hypothetical protein